MTPNFGQQKTRTHGQPGWAADAAAHPFSRGSSVPRPPAPFPARCSAPTRRGTGMRDWPCHFVPGAGPVHRPEPAPVKTGEPGPRERRPLSLGGFFPVAVAQNRHYRRSVAPAPVGGRPLAWWPLPPYPRSDRGPALPKTIAFRLPLLQHHGVAPFIDKVSHRDPVPAVVANAVGVLHFGALGCSRPGNPRPPAYHLPILTLAC